MRQHGLQRDERSLTAVSFAPPSNVIAAKPRSRKRSGCFLKKGVTRPAGTKKRLDIPFGESGGFLPQTLPPITHL
jgi:hypothetical protein